MGRSSIFSVLCVFSIAGGLSFTLATTIASFPCGGNITSHYARIKSPNYPSSYDNNLRCLWTIDRRWDSEILLRIRHFSTEQCCDKLLIIDKNLGKYIADLKGHCYVRGDRWFSTASNHIELYFETDGSVVNDGFDIIIESRNISKYNFAQTTVPPTKGIVCGGSTGNIAYDSTQGPTTTENTVGFYNVSFQYGHYGLVSINGYEVCESGFNYHSGRALCRSQGYIYSYNFRRHVPGDHYRTFDIHCSSDDIYNCTLQQRDNYCSSVVYMYCNEMTTDQPTTVATASYFGSRDVYIEYGSNGRVYVDSYEICTTGFDSYFGQKLCNYTGLPYNYYSSVSARRPYLTGRIECVDQCSVRPNRQYCSSVIYLYCDVIPGPSSTGNDSTTWSITTADYSIDSVDVGIEYGVRGRVYIQGHEICTSRYNSQSGMALCRSKGYYYSTYSSVSPHDHYNTFEIRCYSDYLSSCNKEFRYHYCSNVVYIYCFGPSTEDITTPTKPTTSKVLSVSIGYSNVYIEHGTHGKVYLEGYEICADGITYQTRATLCHSIGYNYNTYERVSTNHHYGTMNVNCWNTYISSCSAAYKSRYCSFALYLRCNQGIDSTIPEYRVSTPFVTREMTMSNHYTGIRLVGTVYPWKGTIEIMHNGQWGTICDDSFDKRDGDVICRMLGYTHSSQTYQSAHYGQGSGPIWLDDLGCYGYESDVTNCSSRGWGSHNCGHSEDAGVDCGNSTTTDYEMTTYDPCNGYQCYNGGTCFLRNNGYPGYYCMCPNGFSGTNCQYWATTFDPCYQHPCRHGGTCYRNYSYRGYYCLCRKAYSGQHCENYLSYYETTTYDPCYGYPCRHGGTCYRTYPGYYCACATGYTGQHCDASVGFSPENAISVGCMDNTWDISVYLPPLYNRYTDFDPSDLYLGSDSCTGYVNGNYLHFRSGYSACGTVTKTLTNNVVHTNQLVYALHDPNHHYIVHEYRFRVPVDCYMTRNEGGSGHFNHGHDITIPAAHHVTGSSHHSVRLQFYTDSTFRYTKPLYGSRAGDTVYVRAYTDVRDYNLKMRISDCFTTPTSSSFSSLKYFIIQNGCVIDPNARILSQTTHETRFYFQDFEYSTNRDSLYLHCNATFCKSNDYSDACEQTCHHARKRVGGGNIVYGGPVDSMTVNEAVRLTKADDTRSSKSRGNSNMIAVLSVIFGIILITLIAFMVLGKVKKNRQKKSQIV